MAEKFALQQIGGDGSAVHGDEGVAGTARQFVDMPSRHFLAGAGLAENQHIGVEARDLFDQSMDIAHGARRAAGTKTMCPRLGRMTGAHALRLVQHRRQTSLFDGQLQVKPGQITAGLGNLRQTMVAHEDQRQCQGAQSRHQFLAADGYGLLTRDHGQDVVYIAFVVPLEFGYVVHMHRF